MTRRIRKNVYIHRPLSLTEIDITIIINMRGDTTVGDF